MHPLFWKYNAKFGYYAQYYTITDKFSLCSASNIPKLSNKFQTRIEITAKEENFCQKFVSRFFSAKRS